MAKYFASEYMEGRSLPPGQTHCFSWEGSGVPLCPVCGERFGRSAGDPYVCPRCSGFAHLVAEVITKPLLEDGGITESTLQFVWKWTDEIALGLKERCYTAPQIGELLKIHRIGEWWHFRALAAPPVALRH